MRYLFFFALASSLTGLHTAFVPEFVTCLAVNHGEGTEQIKSFVESRQLDLPIALDSGPIGDRFELDALPLTVIINQHGEIAFVNVGASSDLEEKLAAALDQLLGGRTRTQQ